MEFSMTHSMLKRKVKPGTAKRIILSTLVDLLTDLENQEIRKHYTDETFQKTEPACFQKDYSLSEWLPVITNKVFNLTQDFPHLKPLGMNLDNWLTQFENTPITPNNLFSTWQKLLQLFSSFGYKLFSENSLSYVTLETDNDFLAVTTSEKLRLKDGSEAVSFLVGITRLNELIRAENRPPTQAEFIAIEVAKYFVKMGERFEYPYANWCTSGFRQHQSLMSITDPSTGHIQGTATKIYYLNGIIVHIEHLERANQGRSQIESYRIPSNRDVAIVRLLVGSDAPMSSYVGRPVFENGFDYGFLKTVHTVGAAVSELFSSGLAECKLAIEGMTSTQAIEYMKCLKGIVRRDKHTQILSAAFNLNTPIVDDRYQYPSCIVNKLDIGLVGIELALAGGFDKVTWDGSADTYPSKCVLEQLTHEEATTLVHKAHEQGLLTYFSAGFKFHNLALSVYTGVDGVGVGGAQILRLMDKRTGYHGPFVPENITKILAIRDQSAESWLGRAAILLTRLDRMFYEGSLSVDENPYRLNLFEAVAKQEQARCEQLLAHFAAIAALPPDTQHPLMAWAKRILAVGKTSLLAQTQSAQGWASLVWELQKGIGTEDLDLLQEVLLTAKEAPYIPSAISLPQPAFSQAA
jgi:hypothetical protein